MQATKEDLKSVLNCFSEIDLCSPWSYLFSASGEAYYIKVTLSEAKADELSSIDSV